MTTIIIYLIACVLFGAISCFFGRRLYFPIMMLTVFFGIVTLSFSIFEVTTKVAVVTIIVALICALLAKAIYKLGVFLMGCLLGAGLGVFIAFLLPQSAEDWRKYIIIAFTLLIGFCAIKWCDVLIMAATAYNGAKVMATPLYFVAVEFRNLESYVLPGDGSTAITNLSQYLNGDFAINNAHTLLIITLVIAVIGFIYQFFGGKR